MDVDCAKRSGAIRITAREYKNYGATLRRMCVPSAKKGTLQVSGEVADRWKNTKSRKQLIVALINCKGDKDAFNQRMEVVIRNVKEGKVVIDSGYYTESAMKNELKDRVQAIIKYCTKTKARRRQLTRRDKYQKHILEYWIDLKTSGSLSRSHKEEFNQFIEIIDDEAVLPPPVLGNEALPSYEEEDDDADDDDESEAKEDEKEEANPDFREEQEKDIQKIPTILSEILRVRVKTDKTLEELKKAGELLGKQAENLMGLHDELAEIRAECGKDDPSAETSRITMEEKKLRRTILRPVPKAKANIKNPNKAEGQGEQHDEEDDHAVLEDHWIGSPAPHQLPWRVLVVSDRLLCSIAAGFVDEVRDVADVIQALASCNKLCLLWGAESMTSNTDVLPKFWRRWKSHDPQHAALQHHRDHMAYVLPLQLHADEGQTLKKTGVMVINWQSPIGFGVSTSDDCPAAMQLNYCGSSYATRFLYTVCHKKCYSKDKSYVLTGILDRLAYELVDLFYNGLTVNVAGKQVTFFVALLGLKGDWPIQARIGNLTRHFARKGVFEVVITDYALAGPGDMAVQLDGIYALAVQHCKSTQTPLHMDGLTRHLYADYDYPVGSWFKGADTAAMCSFLEAFWAEHLAAHASDSDEYLHGILECLRVAAQAGASFLKAYIETSSRAFDRQKTRFKLTPKFHGLIHIVDSLITGYNSGRRWTLSPLSESTQLDEDFIGRVSSTTTAVSSRNMHSQTLRKYLTNMWAAVHGR
ncbi:unnamed protein product [Symbiodinium necroappetens]|uniref:Uncharacterized protein n=1 Tax=Symbiodinium necroappetens TaxID=1628268 RepID=A0A813BP24_9DINO|nr:unnamed protein product [Symbiodinium necroappetens]